MERRALLQQFVGSACLRPARAVLPLHHPVLLALHQDELYNGAAQGVCQRGVHEDLEVEGYFHALSTAGQTTRGDQLAM